MDRVSTRSVLKAATVAGFIALLLFLVNPMSDIWVTEEELNPQGADKLWWPTTVVTVFTPAVGGILAGIVIARQDKKHYRPFVEAGTAATTGLFIGILAWSVLGLALHGVNVSFSSFTHGFMFMVLGGPAAFLVGGFTARTLVWRVF
jgi:hypothetical protein